MQFPVLTDGLDRIILTMSTTEIIMHIHPNIEQQRDMALASLKALVEAMQSQSDALLHAQETIRVVEDAVRDMAVNDPFKRIV